MAPKGPVIKGSKNVEIRPLRAIFRVASANSTNKGHRDRRAVILANALDGKERAKRCQIIWKLTKN
jgi:hypothetical protein